MELVQLDELQKVLQEFATEAVEIYKYQIALGGHNASRTLTDTISSEVVVGDAAYLVTLTLQEYWKYIEGGSKGEITSPAGAEFPVAHPPISALMKWIEVKPIIPRPDDKGRIPSPRSLAFLIQRKIKGHGIAPFPALATTKEELMDIYRPRIEAALGHDIEKALQQFITE